MDKMFIDQDKLQKGRNVLAGNTFISLVLITVRQAVEISVSAQFSNTIFYTNNVSAYFVF